MRHHHLFLCLLPMVAVGVAAPTAQGQRVPEPLPELSATSIAFEVPGHGISALVIVDETEEVAAACTDGVVRFWDLRRAGRTRETILIDAAGQPIDASRISHWALSTNGGVLLTAETADGRRSKSVTGTIWDLKTGRGRGVIENLDQAYPFLGFSSDSREVVVRLPDGSAALCDTRTGRERRRVDVGHLEFSNSSRPALSGSGRWLCGWNDDSQSFQVVDLDTGEWFQRLNLIVRGDLDRASGSRTRSAMFIPQASGSADGRWLLVVEDRELRTPLRSGRETFPMGTLVAQFAMWDLNEFSLSPDEPEPRSRRDANRDDSNQGLVNVLVHAHNHEPGLDLKYAAAHPESGIIATTGGSAIALWDLKSGKAMGKVRNPFGGKEFGYGFVSMSDKFLVAAVNQLTLSGDAPPAPPIAPSDGAVVTQHAYDGVDAHIHIWKVGDLLEAAKD